MTVKNQKVSYPPSVVPPSPFEFPNTVKTISFITKAAEAKVTIINHGFTTSADVGITSLSFHQIKGMSQMNLLIGMILSVPDVDNITVSINSTVFSTYISGGQALIIAGHVPYDPFENIL